MAAPSAWRIGPRAAPRFTLSSIRQASEAQVSEAQATKAAACRSNERDPHPAVLLALLLDLRHPHRADLAGGAHMRAAAGLQVEARALDQAHPAGAHRWGPPHGLVHVGVGF